jgi:ABC-type oligopeptide transport system ATPase subunit
VAFVPPGNLRERILLFGGAGGGKTTAGLQVARAIQDQGGRLFVLDTEHGTDKLLQNEFSDLKNVVVHHVYDFPSYVEAADAVKAECRKDDWVQVDLVGMAWDAVQRYFVEQVFGKNRGDYFLHIRREMQRVMDEGRDGKKRPNMRALDGWRDWTVVNAMYKDFILPLLYQVPAHLLACTMATAVSDEDEEDVKRLFPMGLKPAGQKDLPHQFDTVILLEPPRDKERKRRLATTFKDRGRPTFSDQLLLNFPAQYLMQRAGWRRDG